MTKKSIQSLLSTNKNLLFYHIMKYPVPQQYEYFLFEKKNKNIPAPIQKFSRSKKDPLLDEFLEIIYKHKKLYKNLPFIKNIYICNSISFNSLHKNSDIDLFIITKKNAIRRARFFSVLFFSILWLKRSLNKKTKKFCLSFYVSEEAQNLYNISLAQTDIYLAYRIAHLVPLYEEKKNTSNQIYKKNKRITIFLKNLPLQQNIFLGKKIITGNSKIKKIIEGLTKYKIIENTIKTIRSPIVIRKTNKHKKDWRWIVISDKMLKFHADIRKKIHFIYKIQKKNF